MGSAHRHARDRRDRPSSQRRGHRQRRRHDDSRNGGRREERQAGAGFLSADRRLHRENLRRRQDPRQLLQARRPSERARNADLAADRPAVASAVSRRLLQRGPGRHPRSVAEPRNRRRHPGADRCQRGDGHFRPAVQRPDRRGARGLHQRRVRAEPDQGAARRVADGPRRRRHASRGADGRVRGQAVERRGDARRRGVRPRTGQHRDRRDQRPRA